MIEGLTMTTALRQSKSQEKSARLTRVPQSIRLSLIAIEVNCVRRTRFSARMAPAERTKNASRLSRPETIPTIARARACAGRSRPSAAGSRR